MFEFYGEILDSRISALKKGGTVQILNGKTVAESVLERLRLELPHFLKKAGRVPHLSVIIVGNDPASEVYVKNKKRASEKLGMTSDVLTLPANTSTAELIQVIQELNHKGSVDGILVQLPLPKTIKVHEVLQAIAPEKDVDCFGPVSLGKLFMGQPTAKPCTPTGILKILDYYKVPLKGQHVVVVGRSNIVGKPLSLMLLEQGATVTVCHSQTVDLRSHTRKGDVVVVAAGVPGLLGRDDFKVGAVVVDVGIHRTEAGVKGDVNKLGVEDHLAAMTPVPGGVGPMTIACLLENTFLLAKSRLGID